VLTLLLVLTAQSLPSDTAEAGLNARCSQLIAYFDRWGVTRSAHTSGWRNHTRLGAEIDCNNGLYAKRIAEMETLLRNKKFTVPPRAPDEVDIDE
jgi:hypothetical protein